MKRPGTIGKPFIIKFDEEHYKKGDMICSDLKTELIVLKVYRRTLWRRFLMWLGFRTRLFQCKVVKKQKEVPIE